ncbi:unnamed protein product [[Candida] boidinii]|uniref:Unnamed protein product n=1 Tax=Candida boidinii TaxID=5477 RepID=A0ACB5U5A3_CANBO|nr:unnamed protein product [[Candida] boidinii]
MIDSKSVSSNTVKNPMLDTDTESISNGLSSRPILKGVSSTGSSSNRETRNSATSPLFSDENKTNPRMSAANDIITNPTTPATDNTNSTVAGSAVGAATGVAVGVIGSVVSKSLNSTNNGPVNGFIQRTSKLNNTNPMNVNGLSIAPPKGNQFKDDMLTPLEQIQNVDMMPPPKAPRSSSNRDSIDTEASPPLLLNPRVSSSNPLYVMSNDTNDGDSQKLIQTHSEIPETPIKKYSIIDSGNTQNTANENNYKELGNDGYNNEKNPARISTSVPTFFMILKFLILILLPHLLLLLLLLILLLLPLLQNQ